MRLLGRKREPVVAQPESPPPFARQLLHETREELDRADRKAQILFAASGVAVSVVLAGVVAGDWSPLDLPTWALATWAAGAALVGIGLIMLGASIFPRIVHHDPDGKVAYFGHVASYPNVEALHAALETLATDADDRTMDQLWVVSRIVVRKYRLIRLALLLLGLGLVLALLGAVGGSAFA
jgi:hypothetical protein